MMMLSFIVLQGASNLRELKPYNVIRKENNEKPSQWVGTTLVSDKGAGCI
jgi:hypothetical protein